MALTRNFNDFSSDFGFSTLTTLNDIIANETRKLKDRIKSKDSNTLPELSKSYRYKTALVKTNLYKIEIDAALKKSETEVSEAVLENIIKEDFNSVIRNGFSEEELVKEYHNIDSHHRVFLFGEKILFVRHEEGVAILSLAVIERASVVQKNEEWISIVFTMKSGKEVQYYFYMTSKYLSDQMTTSLGLPIWGVDRPLRKHINDSRPFLYLDSLEQDLNNILNFYREKAKEKAEKPPEIISNEDSFGTGEQSEKRDSGDKIDDFKSYIISSALTKKLIVGNTLEKIKMQKIYRRNTTIYAILFLSTALIYILLTIAPVITPYFPFLQNLKIDLQAFSCLFLVLLIFLGLFLPVFLFGIFTLNKQDKELKDKNMTYERHFIEPDINSLTDYFSYYAAKFDMEPARLYGIAEASECIVDTPLFKAFIQEKYLFIITLQRTTKIIVLDLDSVSALSTKTDYVIDLRTKHKRHRSPSEYIFDETYFIAWHKNNLCQSFFDLPMLTLYKDLKAYTPLFNKLKRLRPEIKITESK